MRRLLASGAEFGAVDAEAGTPLIFAVWALGRPLGRLTAFCSCSRICQHGMSFTAYLKLHF